MLLIRLILKQIQMFRFLKQTFEVCLFFFWIILSIYNYLSLINLVVGGLLSAHLLSRRTEFQIEDGWPCSGPLLRLAEKVARKLIPGI